MQEVVDSVQEAWGQERREEEEDEAGGEEVGKGEQKCHTFTHKLEDEKVSHMSVLHGVSAPLNNKQQIGFISQLAVSFAPFACGSACSPGVLRL